MEDLKQQALDNIKEYIKSTPKNVILDRLLNLSKKNIGGVRIQEVFNGCFDNPLYYTFTDMDTLSRMTTERFAIKNTWKCSLMVESSPPNDTFNAIKNENPQKIAGFLLCLFHGKIKRGAS